MEPDLTICRVHGSTDFPGFVPPGSMPAVCVVGIDFKKPGCDIVSGKWSSDGTALLVILPCTDCGGSGELVVATCGCGNIRHEEHFEALTHSDCDGEGCLYAVRTEMREGNADEPLYEVAVVPL